MHKAVSGAVALTMGLVLAGQALGAGAQPCAVPEAMVLSERDLGRLGNLVWSRTRGMGDALASDDAAARAVLADVYRDGLAPAGTVETGAYRCRTIKLGGLLPLTAYGWFACTITETEAGFSIEKTSGSQRFSGVLIPAGDGFAYQGALHYGDEQPMEYRGDSDRDQVGCLVRPSEESDAYILELPAPQFESFHDVILLEPAG